MRQIHGCCDSKIFIFKAAVVNGDDCSSNYFWQTVHGMPIIVFNDVAWMERIQVVWIVAVQFHDEIDSCIGGELRLSLKILVF